VQSTRTSTGTQSTPYAVNEVNEHPSIGAVPRTHSDNGNLRDDGTRTYVYDYRNRLVDVTRKSDNAPLASYRYDTQNRRTHKIVYDPTRIGFDDLLRVHFATHDPTQLNRQGADVGPQYRSAIFYANDREKALAKAFIADLTEQKVFSKPIVTTLEPLTEFFPAEAYHQNYVCNNPMQGYVRGVALPKVEKVRKQFEDRLKERSPLDQPAGERP